MAAPDIWPEQSHCQINLCTLHLTYLTLGSGSGAFRKQWWKAASFIPHCKGLKPTPRNLWQSCYIISRSAAVREKHEHTRSCTSVYKYTLPLFMSLLHIFCSTAVCSMCNKDVRKSNNETTVCPKKFTHTSGANNAHRNRGRMILFCCDVLQWCWITSISTQ
jgi:hypothetical protein